MTQSLEDYLKNIFLIIREKKVARVKDVSEKMDVKKPSVINAVKELKSRGLVEHEHYGYIELTEEGQKEAETLYQKLQLIEEFLIGVLGVSEETAESDACEMEHSLSEETLSKMKSFFENFES